MDIVFDKKEYKPGDQVRGRFVVPQDTRQADQRLCFPHVRLRLVAQEHTQIDKGNNQTGGLVADRYASLLQDEMVRESHVIWEHTVTVPHAKATSNPTTTNERSYPFTVTLPENLPATQTFRKAHMDGYGFDLCRISYAMHVSLPPVPKNNNKDSLLPSSEFWETSLELATDIMREACVQSNLVLSNNNDTSHNSKAFISAIPAATDTKKPPDTTPCWHTLQPTWQIQVLTPPWTDPTNTVELQVGPRREIPQQTCFCGLLESTRVSFPLVPVVGTLFDASRGQTIFYTLTDPHCNLVLPEHVPGKCEIHVKLTQTVQWSAQGHTLVFPVRKEWKIPPSKTFLAGQPRSDEDLVAGRFEIPTDLADSYQGKLVQVEAHVIFALLIDGALVGSSPRLTLNTRG